MGALIKRSNWVPLLIEPQKSDPFVISIGKRRTGRLPMELVCLSNTDEAADFLIVCAGGV
jgi:hypothetical protein